MCSYNIPEAFFDAASEIRHSSQVLGSGRTLPYHTLYFIVEGFLDLKITSHLKQEVRGLIGGL